MTYATQARAEQVAAMLNERRGYPKSFAVFTKHGWTVVCGSPSAVGWTFR